MPPVPTKVSFNKVRSLFFLALITVFGLAMVYLFRPFFYPLVWAVVFAVISRPLYNWLHKLIRFAPVSSILTIIIVLVAISVPICLISILLIDQSLDLYNTLSSTNPAASAQNVTNWLNHTELAPLVRQTQSIWTQYVSEGARTLNTFIFTSLKQLTENSIRFIVMLFLMIYTLYYFLKDGPRILKRIMHLSPLGDEYEQMLFDRFISTVRATIKGTFIIASIQGILAAILFYFTGVQAPLIWAIALTLTSMVPGLGAFIIWLPVGLISLVTGHVWQGITILAVGFSVLSIIDNILRPPLVGKDTQMHPVIVLFSTLGGILVFGISGIIIGPVIAALFLSVISIYDFYYKKELANN